MFEVSVRSLSVYYRDEDGIMRAIPKVKVIVIDGRPDKVYTLFPVLEQELILKWVLFVLNTDTSAN